MLIRISRRRLGAYSYIKVPIYTTQVHYTEVPVGTTRLILILQDLYLFGSPVGVTELSLMQNLCLFVFRNTCSYSYQNDTPSFPLIQYSSYYHITMETPRPVLIKE